MTEIEKLVYKAIEEKKINYFPTLKAFARAVKISPSRLYQIAKQPELDEIYNSAEYNWQALTRFFETRFDPDMGLSSFEDLVDFAIYHEKALRKIDRRNQRRVNTKPIIVHGEEMQARREEVKLGEKYYHRDTLLNMVVVFLTETHVVLQELDSSILYCYGNWTFNNKLRRIEE